MITSNTNNLLRNLLIGFVAGVLAVAIVHQGIGFIMGQMQLTSPTLYSMRPVPPWSVPAIINQMFWGGVWGVVLALIIDRVPRDIPLWLFAILFGFAPLAGAWLLVPAIKQTPMMAGLVPQRMLVGFLYNWGFGVGLVFIFAALRRAIGGGPRALFSR
jgi:hypothetical protein